MLLSSYNTVYHNSLLQKRTSGNVDMENLKNILVNTSSIFLSLSLCLFVYPSVCLSMFLSVCVCVCVCVCLYVCVSICLSVCSSVCLYLNGDLIKTKLNHIGRVIRSDKDVKLRSSIQIRSCEFTTLCNTRITCTESSNDTNIRY